MAVIESPGCLYFLAQVKETKLNVIFICKLFFQFAIIQGPPFSSFDFKVEGKNGFPKIYDNSLCKVNFEPWKLTLNQGLCSELHSSDWLDLPSWGTA